MTATKRAPVKTVNKTASAVAKNAAAEKARKAASKAALKAALKAAAGGSAKAEVLAENLQAHADRLEQERVSRVSREAADHAAYLQTLREDAHAAWFASLDAVQQEEVNNGERSIPDGYADAYIAEQLTPVKTKYNGPMLALKTARKAYVKAANGIQCNGDDLAMMCGQYPRETVVKGLIQALSLPGNPYLSLNPGQQSMNLRNKARHALKAGLITSAHVALCLKTAAGK